MSRLLAIALFVGGCAESEGSEDTSSGLPARSNGCGREPGSIISGTIDVDGTARTYTLDLPDAYDNNKKYPVGFAFHGRSGTSQSARDTQHLHEEWGEQIIAVYMQGLPEGGPESGWVLEEDGVDVAFWDALYAELCDQLCFDPARVFLQGHSRGGVFSNFLGCWRGRSIRAIAANAGSAPSRAECDGTFGAFLVHGTADTLVPFTAGEAARDRWLDANGCNATTFEPHEPDPCVIYDACERDPVVWCAHDGEHVYPPWIPDPIAEYLMRF